MQKGKITIATPALIQEMELDVPPRQEDVYAKSRQLKEDIGLTPDTDTPFVVWMQLPSRMNLPDFSGG